MTTYNPKNVQNDPQYLTDVLISKGYFKDHNQTKTVNVALAAKAIKIGRSTLSQYLAGYAYSYQMQFAIENLPTKKQA